MYLKELTLKGFKSFASATTLRFEPGITAVVGPNGSGKSNIVDALTWVMGEQGARNLRGTSMEDVIFAGTSTRPPLGRAQVTLTIDNTDGTLDIDYTEVTISRTIFRNGGSEYAINGTPCRLLDVQELLSDTGLGQQMHVIVGQGRLDAILRADPAGHRAFIEEAAGILKHRKRKERALRKLAATEDNLRRLDDLLGEIRRQMGPLGRQARVSRRADAIQVTLRDAQARILADDATQLTAAQNQVRADLTDVRGQLSTRRRDLADTRLRIEQAEAAATQANPVIDRLNQSWRDLSATRERLRSLGTVADERRRGLLERTSAFTGPDPDQLDRRADELERQSAAEHAKADDLKLRLEHGTEERADLERKLAALRQTMTELRRTAQQRDAQVSRLRELIAREETLATSNASRLDDFKTRHTQTDAELATARHALETLRATAADADTDMDAPVAQAQAALDEARRTLTDLTARQRELDARRITLEAKADALGDALRHRNASGELEHDGSLRTLGRLADAIRVAEGWEEAIAAALEPFAGAIAVAGPDDVEAALERARRDQLGKAALVVPSPAGAASIPNAPDDGVDGGIRPAASLVAANPGAGEWAEGIATSVRRLLAGVGVADEREAAMAAFSHDGMAGAGDSRETWTRIVTRGGDLVTPVGAHGGASGSPSDLSLAARRGKAIEEAHGIAAQSQELTDAIDAARARVDAAQAATDDARARRAEQRIQAKQAADAIDAAGRRIADLERQLRQLDDTIGNLTGIIADGEAKRRDLASALASAQRQDDDGMDLDGLTARERDLGKALDQSREAEMSAKITWMEAARQAESLTRQARMLRDQSREASERKARIAALNARRAEQASRIAAIGRQAQAAAAMMDGCIADVERRRDEARHQVNATTAQLEELRAARNAIEPQVNDLTVREHELDVARERLAAEHSRLVQRAADELGMGVDEAMRDYGPERPVPVLDDNGDPVPVPAEEAVAADTATDAGPETDTADGTSYRTVPYVRDEQVRRLEKARRDLKALGKVNPLATEEFEALEARNQYLNDQRNDVAKSRDDLLAIVKDLDATMRTVFMEAFEDTAEAFQQVFATLFPGGKGRLRLTDADDPLAAGVIVEARPAGKRVRQLGLLSGGERSLTALALLLAIFTARPSPFYVMDEVEAALDDINLSRLLRALEGLREHAQLLIITHQQRTMAIADALYGVTMRADGVTAVISQRLERDAAAA